ncbi:hypothetical protein Misp02_15520 [Microtetraspora sp. NBRC 16547]|nr:hypothetical protein Misp02_15520 [Microtetraspora sp. NBRC 16547]
MSLVLIGWRSGRGCWLTGPKLKAPANRGARSNRGEGVRPAERGAPAVRVICRYDYIMMGLLEHELR